MMNIQAPALPIELQLLVLSHALPTPATLSEPIPPRYRLATRLALVCKDWTRAAQLALHCTVVLSSTRQAQAFLGVIRGDETLARATISLQVGPWEGVLWMHDGERAGRYGLGELLERLGGLRVLAVRHLIDVQLDALAELTDFHTLRLDEVVLPLGARFPRCPHLSRLSITESALPSSVGTHYLLPPSLPSLHHLSFHHNILHGFDPVQLDRISLADPTGPSLPPQLCSLSIDEALPPSLARVDGHPHLEALDCRGIHTISPFADLLPSHLPPSVRYLRLSQTEIWSEYYEEDGPEAETFATSFVEQEARFEGIEEMVVSPLVGGARAYTHFERMARRRGLQLMYERDEREDGEDEEYFWGECLRRWGLDREE